jgi:hypothetical protein
MKRTIDDSDPMVVKIYSNNDEILKKIGQILSSEKSRKIYGLLIEYELNAKEVAKLIDNEENPRLPNIIFHLEKMLDSGMLSMRTKQQRKNGHFLKYYKAVPTVLVVPPEYLEKAIASKSLHKIFDDIFRLSTAVLVIGGSTFMMNLGFFFDLISKSTKSPHYINDRLLQGQLFS